MIYICKEIHQEHFKSSDSVNLQSRILINYRNNTRPDQLKPAKNEPTQGLFQYRTESERRIQREKFLQEKRGTGGNHSTQETGLHRQLRTRNKTHRDEKSIPESRTFLSHKPRVLVSLNQTLLVCSYRFQKCGLEFSQVRFHGEHTM